MKIFDKIIEATWQHFYEIEGKEFVVPNSIPILFFGNIKKYFNSPLKIITVAKNPSHNEFPEGFKRFNTDRLSLKKNDVYLDTLSEYFDRSPLFEWFNHFEKLLQHLDASYYDEDYPMLKGKITFDWKPQINCALHTDICSPIATNPTWTKLDKKQQEQIQVYGKILWHKLVEILEPDLILLSCAEKHKDALNLPEQSWNNIELSADIKKRHKLKVADFNSAKAFWISANIPPISMKDVDLPHVAKKIRGISSD